MTDDRCPRCGAEFYDHRDINGDRHWVCYSRRNEITGGVDYQSNTCKIGELSRDLTAARTRIAELEQQLEMSRDPMVIDEARWLDERNAGAESLARSILGDTGAGSMSPGPCADLQELVRGLRRQLAAKTRECERWEGCMKVAIDAVEAYEAQQAAEVKP